MSITFSNPSLSSLSSSSLRSSSLQITPRRTSFPPLRRHSFSMILSAIAVSKISLKRRWGKSPPMPSLPLLLRLQPPTLSALRSLSIPVAWVGIPTTPAWLPAEMLIKLTLLRGLTWYYGHSDKDLLFVTFRQYAVSSNVGHLLERRENEFLGIKYKDPLSSFSDLQAFSVSNPELYWKSIFKEMGISFSIQPKPILHENSTSPGGHWLPGACLNPVKNCLSQNQKRNLDNVAIVWRDEGEGDLYVKKMTLQELRIEAWHVNFYKTS